MTQPERLRKDTKIYWKTKKKKEIDQSKRKTKEIDENTSRNNETINNYLELIKIKRNIT